MRNPNIQTKIVHSASKPAWNVIGTKLAGKYKIARVPYVPLEDPELNEINKEEALHHARFINWCFNHSEAILTKQ